MKVDSSIYGRYPVSYPQNQKVENLRQQPQPDPNNSVDSFQKIAAGANKTVEAAKNVTEMPAHLQDVITPEETQMLQELFRDFGSRWGVDAYKINDAQMSIGAKGNQIDLTS